MIFMPKPTQGPTSPKKRSVNPRNAQNPKLPINFYQIRECYLRGEGSLRELAIRFEISQNTLQQRAAREQWSVDKHQTYKFLVEKTADQLSNLALDWRKEMIQRGKIAMAFLDQIQEEYRKGERPISESGLMMLARCSEVIDGTIRRAMGIPDKIEVKASEQDFHLVYLAQVKALKTIMEGREPFPISERSKQMLEVDAEEIE
jgi:hypothetical protein